MRYSLRVSEKGLTLCDHAEALNRRHIANLSETEFTEESLEGVTQSLRAPERFWSDNLASRPLSRRLRRHDRGLGPAPPQFANNSPSSTRSSSASRSWASAFFSIWRMRSLVTP